MRRSQQDRSTTTRAALRKAARRLFAERGYANVSADEIVAAAGLTRGALYHHYADKQGLFRAVFEEVDGELTAEVREVMAAAPDRYSGLIGGLRRFLDLCERPEVLQIALTDAPAVLGWQTWREISARHGQGLIADSLREAGAPASTARPVLAQVVLGAVIEAALVIAHAADRDAARADAEQALFTLLSGVAAQPDP
jgi:AcrR family transcriptional regulator